MLTEFLRSSSYSSYKICEHQYYLAYILNIEQKANQSADRGNICHKSLELLARKKLCEQEGLKEFKEEEIGKVLICKSLNPVSCTKLAFSHYKKIAPYHDWTSKDFDECLAGVNTVLNFKNGLYSPLKRHILVPEQYFDIEITEPWASYDYNIEGKNYKGNLRIKGTLDLVTKVDDENIEIIDYKTGQRINWINKEPKSYNDLYKDFQFRLYYYAARRLYPNMGVGFTVFWTKPKSKYYKLDSGPFTLDFDDHILKEIEEEIKVWFLKIKSIQKPNLIYPNLNCKILCQYRKNNFEGSEKTICEYVKDEITKLGIDKVTDKLRQDRGYQGGGRQAKDKI